MNNVRTVLMCVGAFWLTGCSQPKPEPIEEQAVTFEADLQPLLSKHCFECHGKEEQEARLDLRTVDLILTGGESGEAILPGKPEESLLLEMLLDEHMPPEGDLLTSEEIELVRKWIAEGAR